jgi:transcriptional regulator with XRE-family HTH domain
MDAGAVSPPRAAVAARGRRFTAEILAVMEQRGISRSELARRLGASPAYVTKILRGDANFTLASLAKLAAALGAELEIGLRVGPERGREGRAATTRPAGSRPAGGRAASATAKPPSRPRQPAPAAGLPDTRWRVW